MRTGASGSCSRAAHRAAGASSSERGPDSPAPKVKTWRSSGSSRASSASAALPKIAAAARDRPSRLRVSRLPRPAG